MSKAALVKKILILTANPKDTGKLRLDEEVREVQTGLDRAKRRDQFEIISRWAVRADDLRRALLDFEPQIVHFSGHGTGEEGLALENESGQAKLVPTDALANLFGLFNGKIECVLMNACYSEAQAEAIHQHVDHVVGMSKAIGDRAAIKFAVGFYDALGAGRSFEDAYRFGCSAIDFEDLKQRLIPVLKTRKKIISEENLPLYAAKDANQGSGGRALSIVLERPEGQVSLSSQFYVERPPIEQDCYEAISQPGALIRVKAARQMGKTSLMTRTLNHGVAQGYRAVPIYFQEADGEVFNNLEQFLQWFCATITEELGLVDEVTEFWARGSLGSKRKCTNYFQQRLLAEVDHPLVLGLDEVDLIFQHLKIAQDFFALLRTWHERGKNEPIWQKLRLVIVHSKEVYIPLDMHQSPFNVGLPIGLPEFNLAQVKDLAERHGLTMADSDIQDLMRMVGGHPYLVRVALYELARQRITLPRLLQIAPTEEGPYNDHLRRHLENLRKKPDLIQSIQQVIHSAAPVQIRADEAFQLSSMGLVKMQGNAVIPLCELYRQYFRDRLRTRL
ncbi:MAG TPA: AAA-like domain-containing protein [Coleofasciculaceae cyanobacterium]|jgi:hypothetical protein